MVEKLQSYRLGMVSGKKYFKEVLELSEFEGLNKLVQESNGMISWKKLNVEGIVNIVDKKVEGIYWKWDLNVTGITTLWKFKIIKGKSICIYSKNCKDLGNLEEIGRDIYINGTMIETIGKIKKIRGDLICWNSKTLESLGDLEYIGGSLDIKRTSLLLQINVLLMIEEGKLIVKGELKLDKRIFKLFSIIYYDGKINYKNFRNTFGDTISDIEDEELKYLAIELLLREYKKEKEKIKTIGDKIILENKEKQLSSIEKKKIREQMMQLSDELTEKRKQIEGFGIRLDNL